MRNNIDLITGEKMPVELSSIEKRLSKLGINNSVSENIDYYKKELKLALEKIYRLEKDIITLKREKGHLETKLQETLFRRNKRNE
jgi:hypothetical protein